MIPAVGRTPGKARLSLLLFLIGICLCVIPAQAAPSDYAPGTHTLTASPSDNYVTFCVPSGMKASDFREVSTTSCNSYWIEPNNDFGGDIIARNYAGGKILASGIVYPGDTNGPSLRPPVWGCGVYSLITDEYCGSVTISYTISPAGSGDPVSVCSGGCEGTGGSVSGPEVPPEEPMIPWTVVIAGVVVAGGLGTAVVIAKKGSGRTGQPPVAPPPTTGPASPPGQQPEKKPRTIRYILEISRKELSLTSENRENLDAKVTKELEDGSIVDAPEAVVTLELQGLFPRGDPALENQSTILDYEMAHGGLIQNNRRFILSINQKRGSAEALNRRTEALSDPEEFELARDETVRVTAAAGKTRVTQDVTAHIRLTRWFLLCSDVTFEWLLNPPDPARETHLRTNYATVFRGFREAIETYNTGPGKQAHFGFKGKGGFGDFSVSVAVDTINKTWRRNPNMAAGLFLFGHNPPPEVADMFYFTTADEKEVVDKTVNPWFRGAVSVKGRSPGNPVAPPGTEASLAMKLMAATGPLSPGTIFSFALEETEGDIGAAMLLAHNTLRALGREEGDVEGTGLNALDSLSFRKKFRMIRGGYRIIDGRQGETKNTTADEANLAQDIAGPIYHLFGTAFYEIFTSGPVKKGLSPEEKGWGQMGNKMEQWYREYAGRQDPDPEKYCVNIWGIAIADELLLRHPWGEYSGKLKRW